MYYKLESGSETYDKVSAIWDKIISYNKQAVELVNSLGFTKYGNDNWNVAGGISCIQSDTKPEGYKQVGKKFQNLYYPKASNKTVNDLINDLPLLSWDEYNSAIGFEDQFRGLRHIMGYSLVKVYGFFLIKIDDECTYTPADGLVEIVSSEYKRLLYLSSQINK